jgi:hypothetical protein
MKVKLDKRHTLISDQYCCWIEQTRHAEKTGKDYQVRVSGYCGTIEQALESYIDKSLLGSDAESAAELLGAVKDLKAGICRMGDRIDAKILEALQ